MIFTDPTGNTIIVEYVRVTPELAAEWLKLNIPNNRDMNSTRIEDRTNDILNGSFAFNGETIKFDSQGRLIDGQHRLTAITKARKTVPLLVVRGLGIDCLATIDTGDMIRTVPQVLKLQGHKLRNASTMAAAQLILMQGDRELDRYSTNRARVAETIVENRDELEGWASWAASVYKSCNLMVSSDNQLGRGLMKPKRAIAEGPLTALAIIMERDGANPDTIAEFFTAIAEGTYSSESGLGNIVKPVRRYISRTGQLVRTGGTHLPFLLRNFDTVIGAYNRWMMGEEITKIQAGGGGKGIRWIEDIRQTVVRDDDGTLRYSDED
jgi:hypothetical protein